MACATTSATSSTRRRSREAPCRSCRRSSRRRAMPRPGGETLKLSRPWLESAKDKPFFFFFHIYEPHTPYAPPEPYASKYPSKYDGEIATADHVVGELIDELKRLGVYDRAL